MSVRFSQRGDTLAFPIAAVFLIACLAVAYFPPWRTIMPVHDFLDSNFVFYVMRARTNFFLNVDAQLPILHGMSLGGTGISDFALLPNLYLLFPPFLALSIGQCLMRAFGFVGMYLLLTRHLLPAFEGRRIVAGAAAILFALLRHWDRVGTIEILPLAVFALLELASNRRPRIAWSIILFVPCLWHFGLGGFVLIGACCAAALYGVVARHVWWPRIAAAAAYWTVVGLLFEYRTIRLVLFSHFTSQRVEWDLTYLRPDPTFAHAVRNFVQNVIFGQYHNYSGQLAVPIIAILAALAVLAVSGRAFRRTRTARLFLGLLALSLILSAFYAGESSGLTNFYMWFHIPFQVARVIVFHPLLVPCLFALAVGVLCLRWPRRATAVSVVFAALAIIQAILTANSLSAKIADVTGTPRCNAFQDIQTCTQAQVGPYFHIDEYKQLARIIGRPQTTYWVASLDIDPMIAAFNGFQTIDGYADIFSIDYKHAFEKVIAGELDANKPMSDFYRKWGSQVYLFHTLGQPVRIDFCEAAKLGADYIFSPSDLTSIDSLHLVGTAGGMKAYEIEKVRCGTNVG